MGRLIEVANVSTCPSPMTVHVGDALLLRAAGGRVLPGNGVVELLGPFVTAVLGTDGSVVSPASLPNAVLCLARGAGEARIEVMAGEVFYSPRQTELDITVEAAG